MHQLPLLGDTEVSSEIFLSAEFEEIPLGAETETLHSVGGLCRHQLNSLRNGEGKESHKGGHAAELIAPSGGDTRR